MFPDYQKLTLLKLFCHSISPRFVPKLETMGNKEVDEK